MSKRDYDEDGDQRRKKPRRDDEEPPDLHSIFNGEVSSVQKYGVFVKIPGHFKQGLVHKSQMSKSKIEDPSEMLSVGERVYCKVISTEDNKISLSMKMVSQTTGNDLDPNNVELSLDEKKRRQFNKREREKIELGAVLNTTCRRCGGHGHFAQDCYVVKGNKSYELVPEFDENKIIPEKIPEKSSTVKKKKKEKKHKKEKKKKIKSTSSSDSSDSDTNHRHV
ncbi:hypothetical protein LOTGIDRAFT_128093 [Lottia gigantea]|uniref:CCHC-type domain-containing protein n=1 Tax=Lottia gigantea TaxID=225164 RepID=V4BE00_LOTGI|nr:hypothetical protein LOTGIDRAFT_128093 [Lottia gigantea]ESO87014.1 hypothetical protein LOTGIDRAFT_128093 [Lottia gigantea]